MCRNLKAITILLGSVFVLLHSFSAYAAKPENSECPTLHSKYMSILGYIEEINNAEDCVPQMDNSNKRPQCPPSSKAEVQRLAAQMKAIKAQMAQLKCDPPICFIPGLCD